MASIHTDRAKRVAREKGGFAGNQGAAPLWEMSKRELVELVIRLGSQAAGAADDQEAGIRAAMTEHEALCAGNII